MLQELKDLTFSYFKKEDIQSDIKALISQMKGGLLSDEFANSVFEDKTLNIHQEKLACKSAFRNNSFVQTAVNNAVNSILGDKTKVVSKSQALENYANNYYLNDSGLRTAEADAITEALISGDGYIIKKDNKFYSVESAEKMYKDFDYKNSKIKRYLLKITESEELAKAMNLKSYTTTQPYGMVTFFGKEYSSEVVTNYKFGNNGLYGRSSLASTLKDVELLNILERSVAVIGKYKAVPRNILMAKSNSREDILDQTKIDMITKNLEQAGKDKTPAIGVSLDIKDLSDGGKDIDLEKYLNYFKRKVTIILTPEFIIFGENATRATSREQKQVYYLNVASIRNRYFLPISNHLIYNSLAGNISKLKDKGITTVDLLSFEYHYGEFAIELPEEKDARLLKEWDSGVIMLNEYREMKGYKKVEIDGFKWEFTTVSASEGTNEVPQIQ